MLFLLWLASSQKILKISFVSLVVGVNETTLQNFENNEIRNVPCC